MHTSPTEHLRRADKGDGLTPRKRGYSYGELPSQGLNLTELQWGVLGGDVAPKRTPAKRKDSRSWMTGWSEDAQAKYFLGRRHSGVWDDQAFHRLLDRLKRTLPDPIACASCHEVFQPQRRTAKYCGAACRKRASRLSRQLPANKVEGGSVS